MADHLAVQELSGPEREDLYAKFIESTPDTQPRDQDARDSLPQQAIDVAPNEAHEAESAQTGEYSSEEAATQGAKPKRKNLVTEFQELSLLQKVWYYFFSIFSRKPPELLFRRKQLQKVCQEITRQNGDLVSYDRRNKIYLVSSQLPERFNAIFKLSLDILPIINQVNRNLKFMQDIITKLIFANYKNASGDNICTDASNFVSQEDLRKYIFMGGSESNKKIESVMKEVYNQSTNLPISLYKYSVIILKPLYQFQKICYFPYSNFFHSFRTEHKNGNSVYSNILPQDAYDSIYILYLLIQEVGTIDFDKIQFREIISSYFNVAERQAEASASPKTAVNFLESFENMQTDWNSFIKKVPIDSLLLFAAENPYMDMPMIRDVGDEVLENLPRQLERAYQQVVQQNIEEIAQDLREHRTQYLYTKYLSDPKFAHAVFYNNDRTDLLPRGTARTESDQLLFAHCESFAYVQNFLGHFGSDHILKPLHTLIKSVFRSDKFIYNRCISFLSELENYKIELGLIDQNLKPEHRTDREIKETVMRIEQRSEGAREEYSTMLMNIDREVRFLLEQIVKELQDFTTTGIPAMGNALQNDMYKQKFVAFMPQIEHLKEFINSSGKLLQPTEILERWKQYISEFCMLLLDQLESERQDILGQMSRMAAVQARQHR